MQIEILAMGLVDAFLIARKFLLRWKQVDDSESAFFRFLRELLPTIADANEAVAARQVRSKCSQTLIGKGIVQKGSQERQGVCQTRTLPLLHQAEDERRQGRVYPLP